MGVYFILWVTRQYAFTFLVQILPVWPWGLFPVDRLHCPVIVYMGMHVCLPFLHLWHHQGLPAHLCVSCSSPRVSYFPRSPGPLDPQCPAPPSPPGEGSGASVTLGSERLRPCLFHPLWAVGFGLWCVRSHDAGGEAGHRGCWTSECPLLLGAKKLNQLIGNKMCIDLTPTPWVWGGELSLPGVPSMAPLPCPCSQSPPRVQAHHLLPLPLSSCNREECFVFHYRIDNH